MDSRLELPSSRLLGLVRTREQVDGLAVVLLPSRSRVFNSVSLSLPNVDGTPELAFIRIVSWLYVHYFEVGRVGVRFLVRRNARLAGQGQGDGHLDTVHALRTWSQHNLNLTGDHDAHIALTCGDWFVNRCGTRLPRTDDHWTALLTALLREAHAFFERLLELLAAIEEDADRDVICQQWEDRLNRDWPAHRYHSLIATVASDLGRDALDPKSFYDRHGHSIREGLKLVSEDGDLEDETRKLIERALLAEAVSVLPITGRDVIDYFDISPGPEVGRLLECARRLYSDQPSDRAALLVRIKNELGDLPSN
ncbi:hypothetical protein [Micromonospora echinofusca]|uniref:hypothetical protein n=1 Tax=Micromonospora echinofusca TaxID=47858 RepID=UPI0033EBC2CE